MAEEPIIALRLYIDRDMGEAEILPVGLGQVAVYSARSPEQEGQNEDSAALIPFDEQTVVMVIADGVGGGPGGRACLTCCRRGTANLA